MLYDRSTLQLSRAQVPTPLNGPIGGLLITLFGFGPYAKLPGAPDGYYLKPELVDVNDAIKQAEYFQIAATALANNEAGQGEQGFELGI